MFLETERLLQPWRSYHFARFFARVEAKSSQSPALRVPESRPASPVISCGTNAEASGCLRGLPGSEWFVRRRPGVQRGESQRYVSDHASGRRPLLAYKPQTSLFATAHRVFRISVIHCDVPRIPTDADLVGGEKIANRCGIGEVSHPKTQRGAHPFGEGNQAACSRRC